MQVTPVIDRIILPHLYTPRSYQARFLAAMREGCKRAAVVWHRRAGKDLTILNWFVHQCVMGRPGTYYYFFPTYAQGKKILWDGFRADGLPFLSAFPTAVAPPENRNETEMQIRVNRPDGYQSIFQIIGTDKMDSVVGTNPIGCGFSEYSLQNPKAWDLFRPILAENGGWAVFDYTPRGRNWGWRLWQTAVNNSATWYSSLLTVDQTRRDAAGEARQGEPVISREAIDQERRDGMAEELIQQEFYCSFEGAIMGAYYGDAMKRMREEGRIRLVRYDPGYPVETSWDIGIDDETSIGFTQEIGDTVLWIDHLRGNNKGLDFWAGELRSRPYSYHRHFGPHDLQVREYSTGNTRKQAAARLGLHFEVVPRLTIDDGIGALRRLLARSVMDEERCQQLIAALNSYHREFDDKLQTFLAHPEKDWSSHDADMARYRAVMYSGSSQRIRSPYAQTRFNTWLPPEEQAEADTRWFDRRPLGRNEPPATSETEGGWR